MRNSVLPVMGVLTVISGAVGLQLGESAISQIDPLYFEGAAPSPRDVSKDPRPQRAPGFAEASGWAEGYEARAADCGPGCASTTAGGYAVPAAPLFEYSDATIQPRWEQAVAPMSADDLRIDRTLRSADVERYLHFQVSSDQAEIRAGLEGELPAEAAEEPIGL
jgi:hypothetical protein